MLRVLERSHATLGAPGFLWGCLWQAPFGEDGGIVGQSMVRAAAREYSALVYAGWVVYLLLCFMLMLIHFCWSGHCTCALRELEVALWEGWWGQQPRNDTTRLAVNAATRMIRLSSNLCLLAVTGLICSPIFSGILLAAMLCPNAVWRRMAQAAQVCACNLPNLCCGCHPALYSSGAWVRVY